MALKKKPLALVATEKPLEKSFTDLREVMDYNRDFSMFYSGVEYEIYLDGCYDMGVRNFLMSYEYLRGKGSASLKKHPDMHLFIDSGVFTYLNDVKYENYTVEQWEAQLKEYLIWAEKHKSSIFGMAEMDLQSILGMDVIEGWRRDYFEPFMLRTGIPVCFIYHGEGMDIWEKMCQRYPYVGITTVADEGGSYKLDGFRKILKIAEDNNTLVHGFGMTQTSLLPQLPFYTVDSTSWKSGFRYGQIAVWNGKRLGMYKRADMDTKVFPVINSYRDIKLDLVKIKAYHEPEVLRANVYAYQKAEENIIKLLIPLTYWKKGTTRKTDVEALPSNYFPPVRWITGQKTAEEIKEYAKRLNINPDYDKVELLISDVTVFVNWKTGKYDSLAKLFLEEENQVALNELHNTYINRIVKDDYQKVEDLIEFFTACVSGKSDRLLQVGTTFDRVVRERDEYIEEDGAELIDVTDEEIKLRLKNMMPELETEEGMPEIDALDEEIFGKADIIPTYDDNGRFLKGQVAVKKPKQVYSKKYPKFACDTCFAAARCVEFKAGHVCAFNKLFQRFDTRNSVDIIEAMQGMVNHNLVRMQRSMILETMGGVTDAVVSGFINQNMNLLSTLQDMYSKNSQEVLRQSRVVHSDGSREEVTQITNPQQGSILERLFNQRIEGKEKGDFDQDADFIEVEAVDVKIREDKVGNMVVTEEEKQPKYYIPEDD